MLESISILFGANCFVSGLLLFWYLHARPAHWVKFTEKEHAFWIKRGFPVEWAGACKKFEQDRGFKALLVVVVLLALVLAMTPFVLSLLLHRHG